MSTSDRLDAESERWASVHWGYGDGLLVCPRCAALVLPDDRGAHVDWHDDWERRLVLIERRHKLEDAEARRLRYRRQR